MKTKTFCIITMCLMMGIGNVEAQGFLNKVKNAAQKAGKAVKEITGSDSQQSTPQTSGTGQSSSSAAGGVTTMSDTDGNKGNLYVDPTLIEYDDAINAQEKNLSNFKKTSDTKVITVDGISGIKLGVLSDNRIFAIAGERTMICMDGKGNIIKKWAGEDFSKYSFEGNGYSFPRFENGRCVYMSSILERTHKTAFICDENFRVVKEIKKAYTFSNFMNGVTLIYTRPEGDIKKAITYRQQCVYLDPQGNEQFTNISNAYKEVTALNVASEPPLRPLSEGLAAFSLPKKGETLHSLWGFRDAKGKIIVPAKYDEVRDFHSGMAAVCTAESGSPKWGFIDKTGKEAIAPKFSKEPSHFDDCGLALVANKQDKLVYINKQGEVVSGEYDEATPFCNGKALVLYKPENKDPRNRTWPSYALIDSNFKVIKHVLAFKSILGSGSSDVAKHLYDIDHPDRIESVMLYDGSFYVKLSSGNLCLLSDNGDGVIAGLSAPFVNGLAPVKSGMFSGDSMAGYVNTKGEWVIKFEESNF